MFEAIQTMIIAIAIEAGIPPYLALSMAIEENQALNPWRCMSMLMEAGGTLGLCS